jgi:hypothetical protein
MTLSEAYDRLLAGPVSQIDWKDGSGSLRTPYPLIVRNEVENEPADIWLEASYQGLCLHFNAKNQYGEFRPHTEPLSNIARII